MKQVGFLRKKSNRTAQSLRGLQATAIGLLLAGAGSSHADINATAAATSLQNLGKLLVQVIQIGLVVAGMTAIGYGLMKWRKKGSDAGGDQVEARQILMPIAAGAAMICIWAVVEFVVTAGGGATSDIGKTKTF